MQMDVSHLLDSLNDNQREAVTAPAAHRLVLAGAGSGKTSVLTRRIGWLIQVEQASVHSILAVTFTNKAAAEMRQRIEPMLGYPIGAMWVGTFHGIAHRLLRMHWEEAGLPRNFQILDSDDQKRLVRRVIQSLELDEKRWPPKLAQWYINGHKEEGRRSHHVQPPQDPQNQGLLQIYKHYEETVERLGVVDFAELLLRAHELVRDNPELQQHYQRRFQHILVDEFQDTNSLQYAWIRVLAGDRSKVFVVGDDDQSIYGWRGAKIENIQNFNRDFSGAETIRLEQNYRSTGNILNAANAVISRNSGRLGKELWTDSGDGEAIDLYAAWNEQDEAQFVVDRIKAWVETGGRRDEVAILYRSNAQSRVFEERLIAGAVPYRVYGGHRFFERQEIKDALAYLRLIENDQDDTAFERVVNLPARGIGNSSLEKLRAAGRAHSCSLWRAVNVCAENNLLAARANTALAAFVGLIASLRDACHGLPLHEQVEHVIEKSGLLTHYQNEKGDKAEARVENLKELVSAARNFDPDEDVVAERPEGMSPLAEFLSHAALEAGEQQGGQWEDCVQMMTLHSAKGLEFPLVFLVGLEEGLFPHQNSMQDAGGLEEERRLAYVGMTRGMQKLVLSHAESRRLYGKESPGIPSRFIDEVPAELMQEIRPRAQVSQPVYRPQAGRHNGQRIEDTASFGGISLGKMVSHAKFGDGIVMALEGSGPNARVQVNFNDVGNKWLVMQYANLTEL